MKTAVQTQYQNINKDLATAKAGITLASNLASLAGFNPKTVQEIDTYGNAAVQIASGVNELMNGAVGLASTLTGAGAVVGGALLVYNLLQDKGPSQDSVVQAQLAALGNEIKQLRTQMNARFDVIDQNLNVLYQTINTDFNIVICSSLNLI